MIEPLQLSFVPILIDNTICLCPAVNHDGEQCRHRTDGLGGDQVSSVDVARSCIDEELRNSLRLSVSAKYVGTWSGIHKQCDDSFSLWKDGEVAKTSHSSP